MAAEKKTGGKARKTKSTGGRGARGGLARKVEPDESLAAIVGTGPLTRADLTRKIWDYVKKNELQDPKDRRSIRADAKLKLVFGGKNKVTMFEMTRLVNQHVKPA